MSDYDRINDLERKLELVNHRLEQIESFQDFFNSEQKRAYKTLHATIGLTLLLTVYFFQSLLYTQTPWMIIVAMFIGMLPVCYRLIKSL